jgi:tRNA 2-thiouridine synthesizing protein E
MSTEEVRMAIGSEEILRGERPVDPQFPHAPAGWTRDDALEAAGQDGLVLQEDHWEVVRALQAFYERHAQGTIRLRDLHDALDERFHLRGGLKFLYTLLPGGPIAQGCRLAGLKPPSGATDASFGSVA